MLCLSSEFLDNVNTNRHNSCMFTLSKSNEPKNIFLCSHFGFLVINGFLNVSFIDNSGKYFSKSRHKYVK